MTQSSRGKVLGAVLAVLVIVVGIVVLVQVLGNDTDEADDTAATGSAEPTGATEATSAAEPQGCTTPPPMPESPPSFTEAPDPSLAEESVWTATLETNCGDIVLELFGDKAPQTVSSFVFLAREGFWQDSPCHRLTTQLIFVLQCGDPTGTGAGGPGYGYGIENAPEDGLYPRGTVAMARTSDPNSNGSQFFIVFSPTVLPTEGGGYSIFGKVLEGMDIVGRIAEQGGGGSLGPQSPAQPISILDVTVEKKA